MHNIQGNSMTSERPSASALRTATARAVHQLLDDPVVFADPLALRILGPHIEQDVRDDPFQFNDPAARTMRAALVARSRLAEDELHDAVQQGVRQYVMLGAGLETFVCRNPYHGLGLRAFEVDRAVTQRWKRTRLAEASIEVPESATFVSVDLDDVDSLAARLGEAGFRWDRPACFSWLGGTPYLGDATVLGVLACLARCPAPSRLVFDYRVPTAMLKPLERMMEEHVAELFAATGEPWLSAFDPAVLQRHLASLGFTGAESLDPVGLNTRYFPKRRDGLQTAGGGLRVMRAWR